MTDPRAPSLAAAARTHMSDTMTEAEARREGYARGYDEASKRSGARIAELEHGLAILRDNPAATHANILRGNIALTRDQALHIAGDSVAAAYARGAAAMREAAAALCEKVADMGDPAREETRRCMARGIRALPLPGEVGERCACDDGALGLGERGA